MDVKSRDNAKILSVPLTTRQPSGKHSDSASGSAVFLRQVLDKLPEPLLVVDAENRIQWANPSASRLFGYHGEELAGTGIERLLPQWSKEQATSRNSGAAGSAASVRPMLGRHRRGGDLPLELHLYPLENAGQPYALLRLHDLQGVSVAQPHASLSCCTPPPFAPDQYGIIAHSEAMASIFERMRLIADSRATVLIQGESGTGKELIARAIHQQSGRRAHPFVAVDCGTMPESLLESELFGHLRGAFTGACSSQKGLFEAADQGTLLLDEIDDTTSGFQSKLLRVLQEGEIRPIGSHRSTRVDVRIIAATKRDLQTAVSEKRFREDLFYRLAVVPLIVPPLRDRREDIPLLVAHFIRKYAHLYQVPSRRITPKALAALQEYAWPGNVRELEHSIERGLLLSHGPEIDIRTCFFPAAQPDADALPEASLDSIARLESERIACAIRQAHGNRSEAARLLHISRSTLYNKLKRYHSRTGE